MARLSGAITLQKLGIRLESDTWSVGNRDGAISWQWYLGVEIVLWLNVEMLKLFANLASGHELDAGPIAWPEVWRVWHDR